VLGEDGFLKLVDFGVSKGDVVEDHKGGITFCGSLIYIAPEILSKAGHGKSVDWYLLGATLYEMIVGVPPYYSKDAVQLT
jgi:serine/threonine protein kinase